MNRAPGQGGAGAASRVAAAALAVVLGALAPLVAADGQPAGGDLDRAFAERVRPLLQRYCWSCHGDGRDRGGVSFDHLAATIAPAQLATWIDVRNVLDVAVMPPDGKPQPTAQERGELVGWIGQAIDRFETAHRETGGDTVVRRINHRAYGTIMTTLLGVPGPRLHEFPEDGTAQGFDTVGSALFASAALQELYYANAVASLDLAVQTGQRPAPMRKTLQQSEVAIASADLRRIADLVSAIERGDAKLGKYPYHLGNPPAEMREAVKRAFRMQGDDLRKLAEQRRWWEDPAVLPALREALAACTARVDGLKRAPQPRRLPPHGPGSNASRPAIWCAIADAGWYRVRARMVNRDPELLLPVRLTIGDAVAARFLPAAGQPDVYEARVFLRPGKPEVSLQVDWRAEEARARTEPFARGRRYWGLNNGGGPEVTVDEFEISGPEHETWPPPATAAILGDGVDAPPTRAYAERIVARFMRRALAGTAPPAAATAYADLIMSHHARSGDFIAAVKHGLAAILSSPRFLYLTEPRRAADGRRRPLSGCELARRLAYALWSDLPDEALLQRAESGELLQEPVLRAEIARLLADPRSRAFREAFTTQWLQLDRIEGIVVPPKGEGLGRAFALYDDDMRATVVEESIAFFSEVLDRDLALATFIDADFAMLNQRLAQLYGIPDVIGPAIRRVSLPSGSHRGGVLTQASVLLASSNGMTTSPVRRGAFILERILGDETGAPPPDVPPLDRVLKVRDDGLPTTPRERLAQHREVASCARCHDRIDPLGLAFEHYDAAGAWLGEYRLPVVAGDGSIARWVARRIETSGTLPDGTAFAGPDELRRRLLERREEVARRLIGYLMIYVLGRELQGSDRPLIARLAREAAGSGTGLRGVLEAVLLSDAFRCK